MRQTSCCDKRHKAANVMSPCLVVSWLIRDEDARYELTRYGGLLGHAHWTLVDLTRKFSGNELD